MQASRFFVRHFQGVHIKFTQTFCKSKFQMLSPLDETELAAAWRRAAGPDGKVPVSLYFESFVGNGSYSRDMRPEVAQPKG